MSERMEKFRANTQFTRSTIRGVDFQFKFGSDVEAASYSHAFSNAEANFKLRSWDAESLLGTSTDILGVNFETDSSVAGGRLRTGTYEVRDPDSNFLLGRPTVAMWTSDGLGLWAELEFRSQEWLAEQVSFLEPHVDGGAVKVGAAARDGLSSDGDDLMLTVPGIGILTVRPKESYVLPDEAGVAVRGGVAYVSPQSSVYALVLVTESTVVEIEGDYGGQIDAERIKSTLEPIVSVERVA